MPGGFQMDVTKIPFNYFMKIRFSEDPDYLLELDGSMEYLNHINTVHASAQFALAEASSGEFLLKTFGEFADNIIPVVRKSELKFKKPVEGKIRSKASMTAEEIDKVRGDIANKGRSLFPVRVEIFDSNGNLTLQAEFEWFVQKMK